MYKICEIQAIIIANNSYGVSAFGADNAELNIDGTITSANTCIGGNGSYADNSNNEKAKFPGVITVNVTPNAKLTATGNPVLSNELQSSDGKKVNGYLESCAIYQPNFGGVLNISGGTITSCYMSAVEIRRGSASISGGTFVSNASEYKEKAVTNSDGGPEVAGAAIAINYYGEGNITEKKGITVTISGGTFAAEKALALKTASSNSEENKLVKATVEANAEIDVAKTTGVAFGTIDGDLAYYLDYASGKADNAGANLVVRPDNAQEIINSINTGKIYFSAGTYDDLELTQGKLVSALSAGGELIGDKTLEATDGYDYYRSISNLELIGGKDVTLRDLTMTSGHIYGKTDDPVTDPIRGYTTTSTSPSYKSHIIIDTLTISDFTFDGGQFALHSALVDSTASDVTISNCVFNGDTSKMSLSGYQAIQLGYDLENFNDISVKKCIINNYYQGFYGQNIKKLTIEGCTISNTKHNALAIQSGSTSRFDGTITISGNTITGSGDRAIRFGSGKSAKIVVEKNNFEKAVDSGSELLKITSLEENGSLTMSGNTYTGGVINEQIKNEKDGSISVSVTISGT